MTKPKYCPQCAKPLGERMDGGLARAACPDSACGFVYYDNPTPVVAALVEHRGNIVLIRNKGWPEGWFGLVSGFLERDEAPAEGVLRELKEELGLSGTIEKLIGVYPFFMRNQIIIAYHVRAEGEIALGEELCDYKIVSPEKLRPWPLGTGEAVRDWLKDRGIDCAQ